MKIRRVCVFCGSSPGTNTAYAEAARNLGKLLVDESIELVYGGGSVGIMGELSNSVLNHGGKVIGVIPSALARREVANKKVTDLRVVANMHDRKSLMADLADAFIALPGGIGTLEEFAEIFTWAQLGLHDKPCGMLNIVGYYNDLISFLDNAVKEGFLRESHRKIILIEKDPVILLQKFKKYTAPPLSNKWIKVE